MHKMNLFSPVLFSLLLHLILCGYTQPSRGNDYTLGKNLMKNPQISIPVISPNVVGSFDSPINGWYNYGYSIQYIDACINTNYAGTCRAYFGVICGWQFLDADSYQHNQMYYQPFNFTAGRSFRIVFDYISEVSKRLTSTGLSVLWNNDTIITFYDDSCTLKTMTFYVVSKNGINQLAFKGMGIADSAGIMIRNVWLQELIYPDIPPPAQFGNLTNRINNPQYSYIFTTFDYLINSTFATIANSFSAKRNLRFILGYILEFNHYILYNYHLRNYTLVSNVILAGMQAFDDEKGYLLDSYIYPLTRINPAAIDSRFKRQNNLTANIKRVIPEYQQRAHGILLEITDMLLLDLPITLVLFTFGFIFFKLLFHKKISLMFRQYSLLCYFLYVLTDGRIEIMTFYFTSEALLLYSSSFLHKLQVVVIIFGYFFIFFFTLTSTILYRSTYGKLLKYIFHNCKKPLSSTLYMTVTFGIYNILLGFIHRLLLSYPITQLYVLLVVEIAHLTFIIVLIFCKFYKNVLLAVSLCLMNIARIAFVCSLLAFTYLQNSETNIGKVQEYLFYSFVGFWMISSLLFLYQKCRLLFLIIKSQITSNKVAPIQEDMHPELNEKQRETVKVTNLKSEGEITSYKYFLEPENVNGKINKRYMDNYSNIFDRPSHEEIKNKETKMMHHPKKC